MGKITVRFWSDWGLSKKDEPGRSHVSIETSEQYVSFVRQDEVSINETPMGIFVSKESDFARMGTPTQEVEVDLNNTNRLNALASTLRKAGLGWQDWRTGRKRGYFNSAAISLLLLKEAQLMDWLDEEDYKKRDGRFKNAALEELFSSSPMKDRLAVMEIGEKINGQTSPEGIFILVESASIKEREYQQKRRRIIWFFLGIMAVTGVLWLFLRYVGGGDSAISEEFMQHLSSNRLIKDDVSIEDDGSTLAQCARPSFLEELSNNTCNRP